MIFCAKKIVAVTLGFGSRETLGRMEGFALGHVFLKAAQAVAHRAKGVRSARDLRESWNSVTGV